MGRHGCNDSVRYGVSFTGFAPYIYIYIYLSIYHSILVGIGGTGRNHQGRQRVNGLGCRGLGEFRGLGVARVHLGFKSVGLGPVQGSEALSWIPNLSVLA